MQKLRRHERYAMVADVTIQPGDENPARFTGKVFNVSKSGMAVFSNQTFELGKMAGLELKIPSVAGRPRNLALFGVIRWVQVQPEGNIVGIELLADSKAGDYQAFADHMDSYACRRAASGGFTLIETLMAMVIICLMVTMAMPIFAQAIEQARADAASANLKTIWSAQRVYWLEYHCFSSRIPDLCSMDLVDTAVADGNGNYAYQVIQADALGFTATAARNGSSSWRGQFQIDEGGKVTGTVSGADGRVLTPTQ